MHKKIIAIISFVAVALSVLADGDFITHRYDSFKACRISDQNIVFIGNSITNMGNWHEHFSDTPLAVNRGNSGACSYEALENLESILIGKPAKIFVMIGTNDIGSATGTPESVAINAEALIERVKNESPGTKLHIISTFPSSNGLRTPENHAEINRLLKEVCARTQTTFIDLWDDMQGILDNSISADRLHVTARGYYIWSNALLPYLGDGFLCSLPATTEASNTYKWTNGNGLRVNMLASLPIKADDILMVGGEMFNNGEWHEMLHNPHVKNRAATYSYGDYLTADWRTFLGYMFDLNKSIKACPAQIYLNIGTQDISTGVADNVLQSNYRQCVELIRAKAPQASLYLTSLTPHTDTAKNQRIKKFNAFVASLATELGLTFVDLFAATANANDGAADPRYITTELNQPYLSARGYLQLARTLSPFIGNCTVEADEDFLARYEIINARQELGNLLTLTYTAQPGTSTGSVSPEAVEAIVATRPAIYSLMNGEHTTAAEMHEAYTSYLPIYEAAQKLNQPTEGRYYQIVSVRGDRIVNMENPTTVVSTPLASADLYSTATMWEFQKRPDGSWNIVNRFYPSMYITPAAGISDSEPASGWTLDNHDRTGTYILTSGSAQFHQLNNGGITNWGGGNNRSDVGCAFLINELPEDYPAQDPPVLSIVTDPQGSTASKVVIYTITAERESKKVSEAASGNWILGTDAGGALTQWYLYERNDGTFDICNAGTGNYIDPQNINTSVGNQFMSSTVLPSVGWSFTEIAGSAGKYIITSGNSTQLHQAKSPWRIINWGYGSSVANEFRTDDPGCRFSLSGIVVKDEPNAIGRVPYAPESTAASQRHDLQGRRISQTTRGICIDGGTKKLAY